jgi:hypothetical protein
VTETLDHPQGGLTPLRVRFTPDGAAAVDAGTGLDEIRL